LALPANGSLTTNYTPLLKWNAVTMPSGAAPFAYYQLQLDDNNDFSSPIVDDTTTLIDRLIAQYQYPLDPLVLSPLAANKTYYWRVRVADQNVVDSVRETSPWSTVWTFRTAHTPPTLLTPVADEHLISLRPVFDWEDVMEMGVTGYTLQVSTSLQFTTIAHTGSPMGSSYTPNVDLPKNVPLYWRVQTRGTNGPSAWTTPRSMQMPVNPPAVPVLSLPINNTLTSDYTPMFTWQAVVGAASYIIQVDDNSDFGSTAVNDASSTSPTFTPVDNLDSNKTYYWRVRAVSPAGEMGNWSAVYSLRTTILPPALTSPVDDTTAVSRMPLLDWENVIENTGYTLQVWKAGTTPVLVTGVALSVNTSQYQYVTNLLPGTAYFWKVQTNAVNGPSVWSASFDFTTAP
jgi:hypothetical protein